MSRRANQHVENISSFVEAIATQFSGQGFKLAQGNLLYRECDGFVHIIHFASILQRKPKKTWIVVNLGIRCNTVEQIAAQCYPEELSTRDRFLASIGAQLGKLLNQGQLRFDVTTPNDSSHSVEKVLTLISTHGFRYFSENSSLSALLRRLRPNNFKDWHMLLPARAVRLPILLFLSQGNDHAILSLQEQYRELISSNDLLADTYQAFARRLCKTFGVESPLE
ncbi:hypothetical protein [Candidatus Thiosymbion oneisti]|uniref:hypothetical protein n=1 Tax=Candidatus Thiosymbion oneisti TaxID=589554 RepID=UPI0010604290|nr:hypothetical protein [Candidatus Thiosymbion oneisti]